MDEADSVAAMTLVAEQIGMSFGGLEVLKDINFEVNKHEILGVIGPNGAGKTTLFNIITGIYAPTSGSVHFSGETISGKAPHHIAQAGIARTFQNIRLFAHMTVAETVETAMLPGCTDQFWRSWLRLPTYHQQLAERNQRILALLDRFGLADLADSKAISLSYGLQRKLEIVRALATQPKLLLLDEPAAGMNTVEKEQLKGLIQMIQKEFSLSIILIEHDVKLVMGVVDRVMVLDYGRCIASGMPEAVRSDPAVIDAYLGKAHA